MQLSRVCVFCGSRAGSEASYVEAATALGHELASAGLGVVYGAGGTGIMGAVADSALGAGGEVIGIIPEQLLEVEEARTDLTELHVVADMHIRKGMMHELSDAYIVLPGGLGTYEELFEVVTWKQLGFHRKPIIVIDVDGYYGPLRDLVEHGITGGFIGDEHRDLITIVSTVDEAVTALSEVARAR